MNASEQGTQPEPEVIAVGDLEVVFPARPTEQKADGSVVLEVSSGSWSTRMEVTNSTEESVRQSIAYDYRRHFQERGAGDYAESELSMGSYRGRQIRCIKAGVETRIAQLALGGRLYQLTSIAIEGSRMGQLFIESLRTRESSKHAAPTQRREARLEALRLERVSNDKRIDEARIGATRRAETTGAQQTSDFRRALQLMTERLEVERQSVRPSDESRAADRAQEARIDEARLEAQRLDRVANNHAQGDNMEMTRISERREAEIDAIRRADETTGAQRTSDIRRAEQLVTERLEVERQSVRRSDESRAADRAHEARIDEARIEVQYSRRKTEDAAPTQGRSDGGSAT